MDPAPAIGTALEISGLSKSYAVGFLHRSRRTALSDLYLTVAPGEIFGYLGPNGSGKTTTLKVLMGLVFPDAGSARILGRPLHDRSWRYRVGYVPEHPYLYDYLTAEEYLDYAGRLFGMGVAARRERGRALLERLGLGRSRRVPLRRFSKGMLQRAALAQALLNDPELVFLDEPMSGLDPVGRRLVRNLILELRAAGKTVFFCTHILSDAETLCDRVAVLNAGRLITAGRLDEILNVDLSHFEVLASGLKEHSLRDLPPEVAVHPVGERWRIEAPERSLAGVLHVVQTNGGRLLAVQPVRQSLEDYFFKEVTSVEGTRDWPLED